MKEPTMKEVLKLVEFERDAFDKLYVKNVNGYVRGSVKGDVVGDVCGDVWGNVDGSVKGDVCGDVWGNVGDSVGGYVGGTINGLEWKFVETPKEKVIRLIREGKHEEAIKVLEESE